jgi:hypothetical protein
MGKNTKNTSYTISGLISDTEYEYQVRTRCPEGNTPWTSKGYFTTDGSGGGGSGSCSGEEITIEIILDDYGSETTWELFNDSGQLVAEGGPYQDGQNGSLVSADACLEDGCSTLYLYDAWGDGICCDYGFGSLTILNSNGGVVLDFDGVFGYTYAVDLCVNGNRTDAKLKQMDRKSSSVRKKKKTQ